jgi:hypothetical protein
MLFLPSQLASRYLCLAFSLGFAMYTSSHCVGGKSIHSILTTLAT